MTVRLPVTAVASSGMVVKPGRTRPVTWKVAGVLADRGTERPLSCLVSSRRTGSIGWNVEPCRGAGVTVFEAPEAGPVPTRFVAVTVKL